MMDKIAGGLEFLRRLASLQPEIAVDRRWLKAAFLWALAVVPTMFLIWVGGAKALIRLEAPPWVLLLAGMMIIPGIAFLTLLLSWPWLKSVPGRLPHEVLFGHRVGRSAVRRVVVVQFLLVILVVVVTSASSVVMRLFGVEPQDPMLVRLFLKGSPLYLVMIAFFAVVAAPLVEEILFRRLLFGFIASYCGVWPGLVATSLAFALVHDSNVQFPALFLMGAVMQLLWLRYRSLWPSIMLHSLNNSLAILLLLAVRLSGIELPNWM